MDNQFVIVVKGNWHGTVGPFETHVAFQKMLNRLREIHGKDKVEGWLMLHPSEIYMPECTSDDPTNHQGNTCPVHEA